MLIYQEKLKQSELQQNLIGNLLTFTCSKSTTETLEKGIKFVHS